MYSTILSRESISSVYAAVIPVRPLFATASFILPGTGIHTSSSVYNIQLSSAPRVRRELYSTAWSVAFLVIYCPFHLDRVISSSSHPSLSIAPFKNSHGHLSNACSTHVQQY